MVAVLGISMWSAQKNTSLLLADKAELAVASLVREVRRRVVPAEEATEFLAQLALTGRLDLEDRDAVARALHAAAAAAPQIFGMAFVDDTGRSIRVNRRNGEVLSSAADAGTVLPPGTLRAARAQRETYWGAPIFLRGPNRTAINVRTPVWRDDVFLGFFGAVVTVEEISRFIARSGTDDFTRNRFILFGRDHVLAHRNMAPGGYRRDARIPLPRLGDLGDNDLAEIWTRQGQRRLLFKLDGQTQGHSRVIAGRPHVYIYREVADFGPVPYVIGILIGPEQGLGDEYRRLVWAGAAGLAVVLFCIGAAAYLGRRVSRPVRNLAAGSAAIADLALDRVDALPRSRLRELDEAASAFNTMVAGLRWFETYVPRQLVHRLITRERDVQSAERQVTVLFTDIAGFATIAEQRSAAETATLLNEHFTILAGCIEAENGIVDKYIGDSIMAFWEPESAPDHAAAAVRAVRAIREAIRADNLRRTARGEPGIRLRIGIHSGSVIVGNIGAPGRVNYTVVGDTVNVAARLEQTCKEMFVAEETAILISGTTAAEAGDQAAALVPLGAVTIRGRDSDIDIFTVGS